MWREACGRRARDEAENGFSERTERMIATFERELRESALGNPLDEGILERVERLRGRFKTLVALLGMRAEYSPGDSSLGISF